MVSGPAEITVRVGASAEDLVVLSEMLRACTAELREERGGELWSLTEGYAELSDIEQHLEARLNGNDRLTLLAAFDGVSAGCALAELRTLRDGRRICHLSDLYIAPEFRGIGVGEAVLEHVMSWALDHVAIAVESTALPGARETKNFFENHGFKARSLLLSRSLP